MLSIVYLLKAPPMSSYRIEPNHHHQHYHHDDGLIKILTKVCRAIGTLPNRTAEIAQSAEIPAIASSK